MTAIDKIARYILLIVIWTGTLLVSAQSMTWRNGSDLFGAALLVGAAIFSRMGDWQPTGNLDKATRYGFLTILWALVLLMNVANLSTYNFSMAPIVALGAVIYATRKLFPRYPAEAQEAAPRQTTDDSKEKRKNSQVGGLNPLDILTEDDLYDLRQEIKDEIRNRIFSGSDGELSSLDALLDAQDRKTTRK